MQEVGVMRSLSQNHRVSTGWLVVALLAVSGGCGGGGGGAPVCGNGRVEPGEVCDDPGGLDGLAAPGACSAECTWQEFSPDTTAEPSAMYPAVAMNAGGGFVLAWRGADAAGDEDIFAAVYGPNGAPVAPAFRVNEQTAGYQQYPSVAMDGEGSFVVVWQNDPTSPGNENQNAWLRAYAPDGSPRTGDVQLNTYEQGWQSHPNAAVNDQGDLLVAWASDGQDGDLNGVYARKGDVSGRLDAAEPFRVNTTTEDTQEDPWAALAEDGRFVIAWAAAGQEST